MSILISKNIEENKDNLKELFNNTSDLILYEFKTLSNHRALIAYINGTIDKISLNEDVLKPLVEELVSPWDIKSTVYTRINDEIKELKDTILPINNGLVILFMEGLDFAYTFDLSQWPKRQVEKPTTEMVIRGPKESFVEDIIVNKTLIRGKIKSNNLIFEDYILGEETNTKVSLVYIKGIVKEGVLEEARYRIEKIKIDAILDNGYIESYIDEKPNRLISTVAFTEKPDIAASKILEGSVGILCDGSPNVLTVPKLFVENLHSAEDYYIRAHYATFLRILRLMAFLASFVIPGVYISLITFHQEMVPTELLISIAGQREGVPLSSPFEALLMILFFELIKESGIRLPEAIGQAVTLVGGLVIGQAAVEAGIVSSTMVIMIASTGMAEFVVPKLRESIPILRLIFLFLGSVSGLYGITSGLVLFTAYLVSMKSFGVPYMWPIAPYDKEGLKDTIGKYSVRKLNYRPEAISNKKRRKRNERID